MFVFVHLINWSYFLKFMNNGFQLEYKSFIASSNLNKLNSCFRFALGATDVKKSLRESLRELWALVGCLTKKLVRANTLVNNRNTCYMFQFKKYTGIPIFNCYIFFQRLNSMKGRTFKFWFVYKRIFLPDKKETNFGCILFFILNVMNFVLTFPLITLSWFKQTFQF